MRERGGARKRRGRRADEDFRHRERVWGLGDARRMKISVTEKGFGV
jgi:hypothetical protein